jgi:hypothetical protein
MKSAQRRGISQADHFPRWLAGSPSTLRDLYAQSAAPTAVITHQQCFTQPRNVSRVNAQLLTDPATRPGHRQLQLIISQQIID